MTYYDEEVCVRACEYWNVHGNPDAVWFVETDPKVPLSTQQEEDEDTNVHQTNTGCKKIIFMWNNRKRTRGRQNPYPPPPPPSELRSQDPAFFQGKMWWGQGEGKGGITVLDG